MQVKSYRWVMADTIQDMPSEAQATRYIEDDSNQT